MAPEPHDRAATLKRLEPGTSSAEGLAFYDELPPVEAELMLGQWRGSGFPTGHPMDGLLEATHWHGKRFRGADEVDPLVMDGPRGTFTLNPRLVPMRLAPQLRTALRVDAVQRAALAVLPLMRTPRPAARLRRVEYRGVVTATMIYDALPINDHFRLVDDDTVMGAMDMRSWDQPFLFVLRREGASA